MVWVGALQVKDRLGPYGGGSTLRRWGLVEGCEIIGVCWWDPSHPLSFLMMEACSAKCFLYDGPHQRPKARGTLDLGREL
jgi:hypothetical protein